MSAHNAHIDKDVFISRESLLVGFVDFQQPVEREKCFVALSSRSRVLRTLVSEGSSTASEELIHPHADQRRHFDTQRHHGPNSTRDITRPYDISFLDCSKQKLPTLPYEIQSHGSSTPWVWRLQLASLSATRARCLGSSEARTLQICTATLHTFSHCFASLTAHRRNQELRSWKAQGR
eukprot:2684771-Amphidinium_carterae.2